MTEKPTGPIWIDMAPALCDLSVNQLVTLANLAMNRLDMRAIGEICFEIGVEPMIDLSGKVTP